jgi:UDP-N-acetylglucosamine diphosphorylase/glucosamine-1-phosphate N-acetyltransferase
LNEVERNFATVIMAAGKGTRMVNSEKAKVMFEVAGRPMVEHVVELAITLSSSRIIAVVGYHRESVMAHLSRFAPSVEFVVQEPQLGTGHAVMQTRQLLAAFRGDVLVLSGDVPLLRQATIRDLVQHHRRAGAVATILTADLEDQSGYGRILRDGDGHVVGIVEEKDATAEERKLKEINSGIYIFDSVRLFEALNHINTNNAQKEYYLTDVFAYYWEQKLKVAAKKSEDFNEIRGINTIAQLGDADRLLRWRNAGQTPVVK